VRSIRRAKPQFILWPFEPQDADDPMDRLYLLGEELRSCYKPLLRLYDGEVWQRKKDGCESAGRQLGLGNPVPALSDRGVVAADDTRGRASQSNNEYRLMRISR